jgi:hypothetical protein
MKPLITFGKLNNAFALNVGQVIIIKAPGFRSFNIESKIYSSGSFTITPSIFVKQGVFIFSSSDGF